MRPWFSWRQASSAAFFLSGLHLASFDEQDQLDFWPIVGPLVQDPNAARVFARLRHVENPWRFFGPPPFYC